MCCMNYPPNMNLYEKQIREESDADLNEDLEYERITDELGDRD